MNEALLTKQASDRIFQTKSKNMTKKNNKSGIARWVIPFIAMALVLPLCFHSCQQDELLDLNALYEGEWDDGMIIFSSITSTMVFPEVFVGPATFYPAKGRVQTQTVSLPNENFADFQRTFALVIQNGDGGSIAAQSISVSVNGIEEFSSKSLRKDPWVITRLIYDLGELTTIDVQVKGRDGTYVTVWIEGTLAQSAGTFTDARDNREYKTVTLGSQTWMAENLAYLPEVSDLNDPSSDPRFYVYGYTGTDPDEAKGSTQYETYGALYNWGAATTACPTGWRLPSEADFGDLEYHLLANGISFEGAVGYDQHAKALADKTNWSDSDVEGSPGWMPELNNSSGFSALPGGSARVTTDDWAFYFMGFYGLWWTSTESLYGDYQSRVFYIDYNDPVTRTTSSSKTEEAYSVRCIKE
jgi:uncharacterized protein (TIGR02145 family)